MTDGQLATVLAATPAADPCGRIIDGRYQLLEKLGEGGMGAVYVAEHLSLKKRVALKTIHSTFEGHVEVAARFVREAMVSARIEHPHVVSALDFGTLEEGGAYLVMQLARGESLRATLTRDGWLPWQNACEIAEQIADAVAAAHAVGVVHRDLKPENVVLEQREGCALHVRVLDFGIAHLRSNTEASALQTGAPLTRVGVVMGTPGYMPPEQAVGQPIDERADIYALGVMLWEMIAGEEPFQGNSFPDIVRMQFGSPPQLPAAAQRVPTELASLLDRMLAARADERPASAAGLRDLLRKLRSLEASASAPSADQSSSPLPGLSRATSAELTRITVKTVATVGEWAKTSPKRRKLAFLAVAALLGVLLWRGSSTGGSATEAPPVSARVSAPPVEQAELNEADAEQTPAQEPRKGTLRTRLKRLFR